MNKGFEEVLLQSTYENAKIWCGDCGEGEIGKLIEFDLHFLNA